MSDPVDGRFESEGRRRSWTVLTTRACRGPEGFRGGGQCLGVSGPRDVGGWPPWGRTRACAALRRPGLTWTATDTPIPAGDSQGCLRPLLPGPYPRPRVGGDYTRPSPPAGAAVTPDGAAPGRCGTAAAAYRSGRSPGSAQPYVASGGADRHRPEGRRRPTWHRWNTARTTTVDCARLGCWGAPARRAGWHAWSVDLWVSVGKRGTRVTNGSDTELPRSPKSE